MTQPTKWSAPLGSGADVQELPDDDLRYASFSKIFPQITQVPLSAGGVAPRRIDFNSLFKLLADNIYYYQNGGVFEYSDTSDYEKGALVRYNDKIYLCIQANGVSSTVVAPDSVSPLGSDYWVQVATLADFTNFANTDLSNLSASGQAIIDGKADKDFSNVNAPVQAFKDMSIGWSMPDWSSVINITSHFVTANGPFTAPSDGYIQVLKVGDNYAYIYNKPNMAYTTTDNVFISMDGSDGDGVWVYAFVPISKGQTIYQTSSGGFRPSAGRINFIPCKGAN